MAARRPWRPDSGGNDRICGVSSRKDTTAATIRSTWEVEDALLRTASH
jgi:hypothetical protein